MIAEMKEAMIEEKVCFILLPLLLKILVLTILCLKISCEVQLSKVGAFNNHLLLVKSIVGLDCWLGRGIWLRRISSHIDLFWYE